MDVFRAYVLLTQDTTHGLIQVLFYQIVGLSRSATCKIGLSLTVNIAKFQYVTRATVVNVFGHNRYARNDMKNQECPKISPMTNLGRLWHVTLARCT